MNKILNETRWVRRLRIALLDAEYMAKLPGVGQWREKAEEHAAEGLSGLRTKDADKAVCALDAACSVLCGAYGLNGLPPVLESWRQRVEGLVWCEAHDRETPCSGCED